LDRFQECSTLTKAKEKYCKFFKESQGPTHKLQEYFRLASVEGIRKAEMLMFLKCVGMA
jgi:hypothetical protein